MASQKIYSEAVILSTLRAYFDRKEKGEPIQSWLKKKGLTQSTVCRWAKGPYGAQVRKAIKAETARNTTTPAKKVETKVSPVGTKINNPATYEALGNTITSLARANAEMSETLKKVFAITQQSLKELS